jgi:uncharacterized protein with PQ loop repeat
MELFGWLGSFCLAICALPQAIKSIRDGHSNGLSYGLLILWFAGEVFTLLYICRSIHSLPLLLNYISNILFLLIIFKYKIFPRKTL